jgi:hypothetical protein
MVTLGSGKFADVKRVVIKTYQPIKINMHTTIVYNLFPPNTNLKAEMKLLFNLYRHLSLK